MCWLVKRIKTILEQLFSSLFAQLSQCSLVLRRSIVVKFINFMFLSELYKKNLECKFLILQQSLIELEKEFIAPKGKKFFSLLNWMKFFVSKLQCWLCSHTYAFLKEFKMNFVSMYAA
jgi:hypothetical protein